MQAISVTALNKYVKEILEKDVVLTDVAIKGEISNFVNHFKTGHFYFSLKDASCSVKAVMFRTAAQRLSFVPENGMSVVLFCRVSLFERDGSFQIYVTEMLLDGIGAMQIAFEQLKEKLSKEGLFDASHKRPLPFMPSKVAIVTSGTGAALQDILNITQRRYPIANLVLVPVTVQGSTAAAEIARGISKADSIGADVMIVARGGGSKEDLWVFNDEKIARAAYKSSIPVVSAIGHEIDFTILDFVSDLRAPTPSAAAELVMPDLYTILAKNTEIYTNIKRNMQNRMNLCYNNIQRIKKSHAFVNVSHSPLQCLQTINSQRDKIYNLVHVKFEARQQKLAYLAHMAQSLSPFEVIARGYAVVKKNNIAQSEGKMILKGDDIKVEMRDCVLNCTVNTITEADYAEL